MFRLLRIALCVALLTSSACGEAVVGRSRLANTPPTVDPIADVTLVEDSTTTVAVTMTDEEDVDVLVVTAASDNPALLDASGVVVAGSGADRTITLTPKPDAFGTATITVTVTDSAPYLDPVVLTFTVTVTPVNDAPVITAIADITIDEDGTAGPTAFTVTDVDNDLSTVAVTATSSDTTLLPSVTLTPGGSPGAYTFTVTPAANQFGTSTLTFSANDGAITTTETALLTVNSVNDQPTITANFSTPVTTNEDTATGTLSFTISDVETGSAALTVAGASTNVALVDTGDLAFGGAAGNRTLVVTPKPNQNGTTDITVTVYDGSGAANATASVTFTLNVTSVNDLPTISSIANPPSIPESSTTGALPFTVGDVETAAASLVVTYVSSSNPTLVPLSSSNIIFGGSGANRTVEVKPAFNQFGSSTITIRVTDANAGFAETSFTVDVQQLNDRPIIDAISTMSITTQEDPSPLPTFTVTFHDVDTAVDLVVIDFSGFDGVIPSGSITETGARVTIPPDGVTTFYDTQTRTFQISPAPNAFTTGLPTSITVRATSDNYVTEANAGPIAVTVTPVNDAPDITGPATITTNEDTASAATAFTISDVDSTLLLANVTVTGNSNPALIPTANIVIGGTVLAPTITLTPVADMNGNAIITVNVSDGSLSDASPWVFTFAVTPVNDPPTITDLGPQTVNEDGTLTLNVAISDPDGCDTLTISGASTNTTLIPDANIVFTASTAACSVTRVVTITPAPNRNSTLDGTADITLTVNDNANGGAPAATDSTTPFTVTVTAMPDNPIATDDIGGPAEGNRTVTGTTVLANDINTDGTGTLSVTATSNATGGAVTMNPDGTYTFVPTAGFLGTAGFDYTLFDGTSSGTGHVSIVYQTRMHWYVDSNVSGTGTGTEASPFQALPSVTTMIQYAAGEDIIHLAYGTGLPYGGGTLDSDCDLIGTPGGAGGTVLPTITAASCLTASGTSAISNVHLVGCSTRAVDANGLTTSLSLSNVVIESSATGVFVDGAGSASTTVALDNVSVTGATAAAISLRDATVTATNTNTFAATAGDGFAGTNLAFGSGVTVASVTVGSSGTPSAAGTGVLLNDCTGVLTIGTLDVYGSGTASGISLDDGRLNISSSTSVVSINGSGSGIHVVESGGTSSLDGFLGTFACASTAQRCVDIAGADLAFSVTANFDASATAAANDNTLVITNTAGSFDVTDTADGIISGDSAHPVIAFTDVAGLDFHVKSVSRADANATAIALTYTTTGATTVPVFHVAGIGDGSRDGSGGSVVSGSGTSPAVVIAGEVDATLRSMNITNGANNGHAIDISGAAIVDLDGCAIDGGNNGIDLDVTAYAGDLTLTGCAVSSSETLLSVTTAGTGKSSVTIDDAGSITSTFSGAENDGRCILATTSGTHEFALTVKDTAFSNCGEHGIHVDDASSSKLDVTVEGTPQSPWLSTPSSAPNTTTPPSPLPTMTSTFTTMDRAFEIDTQNGGDETISTSWTYFSSITDHVIVNDVNGCNGTNRITFENNRIGTIGVVDSGSATGDGFEIFLDDSGVGTACRAAHKISQNLIGGIENSSMAGLWLEYSLSSVNLPSGTPRSDSNIAVTGNYIDVRATGSVSDALYFRSHGIVGGCFNVSGDTFGQLSVMAGGAYEVDGSNDVAGSGAILQGWTANLRNTIRAASNVNQTLVDNFPVDTSFVAGTCPTIP